MKNLAHRIFLVLLIFCSAETNMYAQKIKDLDNMTIDEIISVWAGEWKYENDTTREVFIINLKCTEAVINNNPGIEHHFTCVFKGSVYYLRNDTVVYDNRKIFDTLVFTGLLKEIDSRRPMAELYVYQGRTNRPILNFYDVVHLRAGTGYPTLTVDEENTYRLHWKLRDQEGELYDEPMPIAPGFSIPTDVILTKVQRK